MFIQIIRVEAYDACGGPEHKIKEERDLYWATPTEKGRFIIGAVEKHISSGNYPFWSAIPWGAPLRFNGNVLEVQLYGKWISITKVNEKWGKYTNEEVIRFIKKAMNDLYAVAYPDGNYKYNYIPDKWLFNDFGHISVKYFKDSNQNNRLDKNEHLMGDFIHTTPTDELKTIVEKKNHRISKIELRKSHGCIHVKPDDIDDMISKGYLAIGNVVQVHRYEEHTIPERINIQKRISQYEAHFFPGLYKLVIYKAPLR